MSVPVRLTLFATLLAAIFGGALLAGGAADPDTEPAEPAHDVAGAEPSHGADEDEHGAEAEAGAMLPGLPVSDRGLTLVVDAEQGESRRNAELSFQIERDGRPFTDFEVEHEKRMHLIVVRRDLDGFQHLHPEMDADGTWRARDVDLSAGGTYRVFADFTTGGEQRTLGADVHVDGSYDSRALPAPATTVRDDRGLDVTLRKQGETVAFEVRRDGEVVDDELEPYLGAKGHLVTLRAGDLAYLHTHPEDDRLAFAVEVPTGGTYRHFVQFKLDGVVHTAAFTEEVER